MNTNITPPNLIRAIFPIKGNEASVTSAAISHGVIAYPNSNIIFYEGPLSEYHSLKTILTGGVTA